MGKNILIISTSPRVGSNSELLASEFAKVLHRQGMKWNKSVFAAGIFGFAEAVLSVRIHRDA